MLATTLSSKVPCEKSEVAKRFVMPLKTGPVARPSASTARYPLYFPVPDSLPIGLATSALSPRGGMAHGSRAPSFSPPCPRPHLAKKDKVRASERVALQNGA